MNINQSLRPARNSRKGFTMNMQPQVANRYFQVTVLVALLATLLLAAAPTVLNYAQSLLAQFVHRIFVLGQMDQGVIVNGF